MKSEREIVRYALDNITDHEWSFFRTLFGSEESMFPKNNMTPQWTAILKLFTYVLPPKFIPGLVGGLVAGDEGKNALKEKICELKK